MEGGHPTPNVLLAGLARVAAFITGASVFLRDADHRLLAAAGALQPVCLPVVSERALLVHDASLDRRFLSHASVVGSPHVRFWGSWPIRGPDGALLGRLEVADTVPGTLGEDRAHALEDVRVQVAAILADVRQCWEALRAVIHVLPLPVFTVYIDLGGTVRIVETNPVARAVTCQPAEMLLERAIEEVLPWTAQHGVSDRCRAVLAADRPDGFDLALSVGTQGELQFRIEAVPVAGRRLLLLVEDRSERLELQRRKDAFVSLISHELRTPLATIQGAIGLLDGGVGGGLPEGATRLVRLAREGSERLAKILQDLLDIEQIRSGVAPMRKEAIGFGTLLDASTSAVARQARSASVYLRVGALPGARVLGDRERLSQALANLLSNAVRVSPSGCQVAVDAWLPDPARVRIQIREEGRRLSPEEQGNLFTLFPPSIQGGAGLGLGLAVARLIIEAHGGAIGADPHPNRGTTWWVELPVLT